MPDDDPARSALADALDAMADEMREFPNLPTTPEEIALLHRFASVIRKLTADNARLRSVVNVVCGPPLTFEQAEAELADVELTEEDRAAMGGIRIEEIIAYATDPANMSADEALRRMVDAARRADGFDRKTLAEAEACLEKRWRT